jgi:uncharacterized membrane protein YhhN
MVNSIIVCAAFILLIGLLIAEKRGNPKWKLTFKTPLSALFLIAALIQPHPAPVYYYTVLAGLIWGVVGDICLAIPGNNAFRAGLVAFLLGHILYIAAFVGLAESAQWSAPAYLLIAAVSVGIFLWLRPHLGKMMIPVVLYILVISVMLAAAWVAFLNPVLNVTGAWFALIGALCFYASDIFVARNKFIAPQFVNRMIGLPLYYAGQFLIAFSVGLIQ